MSARIFLFVAFIATTRAWVLPTAGVKRPNLAVLNMGEAVEDVSLKSLVNHEEDSTVMAKSIVSWLDQEWIEQEVHVKMAASAKQSYINCREAGEDDIMSIMMKIADDLRDKWEDYDKDAFVNEWDVANYVSDYLTKASGNEACDCSSNVY